MLKSIPRATHTKKNNHSTIYKKSYGSIYTDEWYHCMSSCTMHVLHTPSVSTENKKMMTGVYSYSYSYICYMLTVTEGL